MKSQEQLLAAIALGDRKAFKILYDSISPQVYRTALGYVHQVEDAEEVTQDVFTVIFKKAGQFNGRSSPSTWIYRITINMALSFIEKRKRSSVDELDKSSHQVLSLDHPGISLDQKENAAFLFNAIHRLSPKQKTAIILGFLEELPRQKVADILEISLKATESLLMRAKSNLKKELEILYPERRKSQ